MCRNIPHFTLAGTGNTADIGLSAQSGRLEHLFGSHRKSYTLEPFVIKLSNGFYRVCDNAALLTLPG